ncbi:MGMT family protein [Acinetobacter stercoris]|uniref:Methylated-DNA-protein-cysteine methyltransferase n=1 Tax=Acinetobacter stercoris TaxID=2126983 RepID=A0A2U3N0T0_9GAMM|nr:MGMT family protein [Acinetobacter stercoris]SPL71272.1 Methylated-DNA-protein-cysteine methyltransferase [Acinetobacter stercoris]
MPNRHASTSQELARQILEVVIRIPYGKVASYGQIAKMAGLPKHARLVGYVLKNLDEGVDVPWHRVINSQGKISLNSRDELGENIQKNKLIAEGILVVGDKINLKKFQWLN